MVEPGGSYACSRCFACNRYTFWFHDRIVYPTNAAVAAAASADMPEAGKGLYEEARAVMPYSRRAGAALARASLEAILREVLKVPKANLEALVAAAVPKVSSGTGQMLDVVRHLGNKSLHGANASDELVVLILDPTQTEVAEMLLEVCSDVVDELVTRPAKQAELFAKLPDPIRARIAERDSS